MVKTSVEVNAAPGGECHRRTCAGSLRCEIAHAPRELVRAALRCIGRGAGFLGLVGRRLRAALEIGGSRVVADGLLRGALRLAARGGKLAFSRFLRLRFLALATRFVFL